MAAERNIAGSAWGLTTHTTPPAAVAGGLSAEHEGATTMTAHNTHERIAERLQTLEWQITDARWVLKQTADAMMRRATEATASCEALMKNEPCSLVWTEFAEGDLRKAKEARERLERLIEMQRVLKNLTGG